MKKNSINYPGVRPDAPIRKIARLIFLCLFAIPFTGYAQNILPSFPEQLSSEQTDEIHKNDLLRKEIRQFRKAIKWENQKLRKSDDEQAYTEAEKKRLTKEMDTLKMKKKLTVLKMKQLESTGPLLTFYGTAAIGGGTDFFSAVTSSGQLNAVVNPLKNLYAGVGANLLYANPGNKVKKDSLALNSLMFPETGKFGILATLDYKITLARNARNDSINFRHHFLTPQFSFAYRRVDFDSPAVGFKVFNLNFGIQYQVEAQIKDKEDHMSFSTMPYVHFFNIPNEDAATFQNIVNDTLFSDNKKGAFITSIGIKTILQYNSFLFFFDVRQTLGGSNFSDTNPFKGSMVNVGFATWLKLSLKKNADGSTTTQTNLH